MISTLLLQTGGDIPFPDARVTIHNPTMEEIGFIGEENFHPGSHFLNFSKDDYVEIKDKVDLEKKTDFDIFIAMMLNPERSSVKIAAKMVLTLLFPDYMINFDEKGIALSNQDGFETYINSYNYGAFKEIIKEMFALSHTEGTNGDYNPADKMAEKIAAKFKKRASKNKQGGPAKIDLFSRYISILSVGQKKNVNDFNNYTVYQLLMEFRRYRMKEDSDAVRDARLAGATGIEDVDNWMGDIKL